MTLGRDFPDLQMVIAPRDPTRGKEVKRLTEKLGLRARERSAGSRMVDAQVMVLDTLGELARYYQIADIAFVGGSLVNAGGHNILEPAACGVPVIFGPYIESFREVADQFIANGAGRLVEDAKEMESVVRSLLVDKDARIRMVRQAKNLIAKDSGATVRYLKLISDAVQGRGAV